MQTGLLDELALGHKAVGWGFRVGKGSLVGRRALQGVEQPVRAVELACVLE